MLLTNSSTRPTWFCASGQNLHFFSDISVGSKSALQTPHVYDYPGLACTHAPQILVIRNRQNRPSVADFRLAIGSVSSTVPEYPRSGEQRHP